MITDAYRELNRQLHATNESYGASGHRWAAQVAQMAKHLPAHTILDYGCGKRTLEQALGFAIKNYDPAVEGLDTPPEPADLVVCTDVLEHIEPDYLEAVLDDLQRVTKKLVFLVVATRPAKKTLADGRNAHLIQLPLNEWLPALLSRWKVEQVQNVGGGEFIFIGSKQ
jgi:2-polyprenyl-3-methyl-5-hydroxy-6-metoxy-1,4-benzoquinol methylase